MAVSDGMPILEAAVPCEVFGIDRSDLASPWYRFSVVGLGSDSIRFASWFRLATEDSRADLDRADTVIVPACGQLYQAQPPELVGAVRAAYDRGARIMSVCSGAFVLAAAGILDGRRATTHWMHARKLAQRYPEVNVDPAVLYVEDDNVITSAGTAAAIDACLHMVRVDHGAGVAAEVARRLVSPPHRQGGQAQYSQPEQPPDDDWLAPLLDWTSEHLYDSLVTADLAARAHVSVRTLERRFARALGTSPLQWLLQLRIRRAQQLLETTGQPVDWIAAACGFGTPASMRAHFAKSLGVPPGAYRATFRTSSDTERAAS